MTRLLAGLGLLGLLGILVAEVLLQPEPAERVQLALLLGGVSLVSMLLAVTMQRLTRRSLAHGVMATSLVAVVVAGIAVSAAASATARDVAAGRRGVRTGVERPDELGRTAAALDTLVAALEQAEDDRTRVELGRARFLAAVGHDLRSPLTVLRSGLEAIEDGVAEDAPTLVARLLRETDLLGSLVEDLFLLARIESDGLQLRHDRLDLAELADEAAEALHHVAAARSVALQVDAPDMAPVEGDSRELGRVLRNLLDNAVRHSPPGSTVTVRVEADDDRVRCWVMDQGPGFPPELTTEAFGSFVRGDEARTRDGAGAGLGLAIAQGLVAAHSGTISAAPGPGGRVQFELPTSR